MIKDELFFAWLDGELPADEADRVAAAVAADPELQRRADAHRALRQKLAGAFGPIADQPLPPALADAVAPRSAEVVDLASRRAPARPVSPRMQWMAMAATLALGLVAGTMVGGGTPGPVARENGQLVASGDLEQALYARLASAPADDGARIGLTFRNAAGDLCRSFTDDGAAGLACHQQGDWRIEGLFQAGEGQAGDYRMAAGGDPRLAELVDATIAGEPFDAAGERRALAKLR